MYFFIDVSTNLASGCCHFRHPDFMSTAPTDDTILCYISSIMIQTATETQMVMFVQVPKVWMGLL